MSDFSDHQKESFAGIGRTVDFAPDGDYEALDEDERALQEALAACHSEETLAASSTATPIQDNCTPVREALYHEGATPLFMAVEETRWTDALKISQREPTTVSTWVQSTGTENTTFGWSLWRRLPLHEACRRQPPAWFVASLLRVYPDAAKEVTQFGQLALHLAVEMGASPEVVNLLIVAHWRGIESQDNSGRTPLDTFEDAEYSLLMEEDARVVRESLSQCLSSYKRYQEEWQHRFQRREDEFKGYVQRIQQKHKRQLAQEQQEQETLQGQLRATESQMDACLKQQAEESAKHKEQVVLARGLQESLDKAQKEIEELRRDLLKQKDDFGRHDEALKVKEVEKNGLVDRVGGLEEDLRNILAFQQRNVRAAVARSQSYLQKLQRAHLALEGQLQGQQEGLELLLKQRNIRDWEDLSHEDQQRNGETTTEQEVVEKTSQAAMAALAAAAVQAQQPSLD